MPTGIFIVHPNYAFSLKINANIDILQLIKTNIFFH